MVENDIDVVKVMDCMIDRLLIIETLRGLLNGLWILDLTKELDIDSEEVYLNLKHQGYL